jgi:hypothetical protein
LEELIEGGDVLLFIAKTYNCWELTFATDINNSESSVASISSDNDSDSDLTDTSELTRPLAGKKKTVVMYFFSEWIAAAVVSLEFISLCDRAWRQPPRRIPARTFQLVSGQ